MKNRMKNKGTIEMITRKKKVYVLIALVIAIISVTGCSGTKTNPIEIQEATPNVTEQTTPSAATPTTKPTPTPTKTVESVPTSYTTGLPFDGEYLPVIVSIENSPAARPQIGLQTADIVYEIPVEGSVTRFICVFSDNLPEKVMPVRSARVPFLYIVDEYDAPFMHWGGSGSENRTGSEPYNVYSHHLRDKTYDVDGWAGGKWAEFYYRTDSKNAPHNVVGNPLLVQQKVYDYQPEPLGWLFETGVTYDGETVSKVDLKLCTSVSNYVSYTYDEARDVYLRFMGEKEFYSAETNEQISITNIILQYSTYTTSSKVKLWNMTGSGKAEFYIGGKKITGSWERASEDDKTVFYDEEGKQIVLRPGNTWINICPDDMND